MAAGRVVNAAVPYTLASVVGSLEDGAYNALWYYLFGYVGLRFLQGSGGLAALRDVIILSCYRGVSFQKLTSSRHFGPLSCNILTSVRLNLLIHLAY